MQASVPLLTILIRSTFFTRPLINSAISISKSVGAPKEVELNAEIKQAQRQNNRTEILRLERELEKSEEQRKAYQQVYKEKFYALEHQEKSLEKAENILKSVSFKFSPFLMKLTSEGRKKLQILKDAGLNFNSSGAVFPTIEIARALKLKGVKEEKMKMLGMVDKNFLHDEVKRNFAESAPNIKGTAEQIKADVERRKKDEKTRDRKRKSLADITNTSIN